MSDNRYYSVRPYQGRELGTAVAVGWSSVDFSSFSSENELMKAILDKYKYLDGYIKRGHHINTIKRFYNIQNGDRIIIPVSGGILLGIAKGKHYEPIAKDNNQSNQILIEKKGQYIPRTQLSEGLQRRLRVRGGSVQNLVEFKSELDMLFEGGSHFSKLDDERKNREDSFKKQLLSNILSGKTNLNSGGLGLEKLVQHLFDLTGYETKILPKNNKQLSGFADIDIRAEKGDRFSSFRLYAQVKHHQGQSSDFSAKQLIDARRQLDDDDATYMVITTAEATDKLKTTCEEQGIELIDGKMLVNWIYDSLPNMSVEFKQQLMIVDVPSLLN